MAESDTEMYWEREYHLINNKMKQFHRKAALAREKIYKQIEELKTKLVAAEERAESAETELRILRESLASASPEPDKERLLLADAEERCFKLELHKEHLEERLNKELQARKRDKDTLHEKSLKIKEWVMQTLSAEAEEKKSLRSAKRELEQRVEALQAQIRGLTEQRAKKPALESSSPLPMDLDDEEEDEEGGDDAGVTSSHAEEEEEAHPSSIDRAISQLGEQCNNVRFDPQPPDVIATSTPSSSSSGGGMRHLPSSIRRRLQSLADRGADKKGAEPDFGRSCPSMMTRSKSAAASSSRDQAASGNAARKHQQHQQQQQAPVFDFSRSLPSTAFRKAPPPRRTPAGRAPTPPLHQHAVWESKIYSLTKSGFQFSSNALGRTLPSKHIASSCEEYEPGEYAHVVHRAQPLTVPVYSKIKGKAQQIRQEPLTAPSSDSSDGEDAAGGNQKMTQSGHQQQQRHKRTSRTGGTAMRTPKGLTSLEAAAAIAGCSLNSSPSANPASPQQRNAGGSPTVPRAIKRANSQQSMTSVESDYAIPPDAYGSSGSLAVTDSSEPEYKLLKTSSSSSSTSSCSKHAAKAVSRSASGGAEPPTAPRSGGKSAYLKKLGGRSRTWRKRWFVLHDRALLYYRTSAETCCNVPGRAVFDLTRSSEVSVRKCPSTSLCFLVSTKERIYYLATSSSQQTNEWLKALHAAISRSRSDGDEAAASTTATGEAVVNRSKVLRVIGADSVILRMRTSDGGAVEFSVDGGDRGGELRHRRLDLRQYVVDDDPQNLPERGDVREGTAVALREASGSGTAAAQSPSLHHRAAKEIFIYFETVQHKTSWTRAVERSRAEVARISEFDRCVVRLVADVDRRGRESVARDDGAWLGDPLLVHSPDIDYARPLTSLRSDAIAVEACKLAKAIQRFANHELESASTDFHVTIAQCVASTCMSHAQLRDELFAQLFRSTNRPRRPLQEEEERTTTRSARGIGTGANTPHLQLWKLIALVTPLFAPSHRMMTFFKLHLQRHTDSRSEVGQYASYSQRAVDRASLAGPRVAVPSRTESVSILMHNPYHHSLPFSVPVHFDDGSYQVIGFHGSSTIAEFTRSIAAASSGFSRNQLSSGFALFVNDPQSGSQLEHFIDPPVKVCDVISAWESAARRGGRATTTMAAAAESAAVPENGGTGEKGMLRHLGSPRFVLRRRLAFRSHRCLETGLERLLTVRRIGVEIAKDRFPVSRDLAVELTALAAQIALGPPCPDSSRALADVIDRTFPARYRDARGKNCPKQYREKIMEKWSCLKSTSRNECMRTFLNAVRRWPLCEATFFAAKNETCGKQKGDTVWLAVDERCFHILHHRTMQVVEQIEYEHIVTFGGCREQLMIVLKTSSSTRKLFFSMPKIQIFSCVQLMADYINSSVRSSSADNNTVVF